MQRIHTLGSVLIILRLFESRLQLLDEPPSRIACPPAHLPPPPPLAQLLQTESLIARPEIPVLIGWG